MKKKTLQTLKNEIQTGLEELRDPRIPIEEIPTKMDSLFQKMIEFEKILTDTEMTIETILNKHQVTGVHEAQDERND